MPRAEKPQNGLVDTWGRQNRSLADRPCAECGASFRPTRASSAYCSVPCARRKNGGHNAKPETWWVNSKGYIEGRVWEGGKQRSVKAHRYVMERVLGRRLLPTEDVHHVNGDKQDNRPENLEVLSHSDHATLTNAGRTYVKGRKLSLTEDQRAARREHMARVGREHGARNLVKARAALSCAQGADR